VKTIRMYICAVGGVL